MDLHMRRRSQNLQHQHNSSAEVFVQSGCDEAQKLYDEAFGEWKQIHVQTCISTWYVCALEAPEVYVNVYVCICIYIYISIYIYVHEHADVYAIISATIAITATTATATTTTSTIATATVTATATATTNYDSTR